MENHLAIAHDNRLDLAELVADSSLEPLGSRNIQFKQRTKVWRTQDTGGSTGRSIIALFDSPEFVEGYFMTEYNFTVDSEYRIQGVTEGLTGGTINVVSGNDTVTKSGGPDWTASMVGTDFVYGASGSKYSTKILTVDSVNTIRLTANAPASYNGSEYNALDFENAYDEVSFPNGYKYDSGIKEVWKSVFGAGEDRFGFHGAGGFPDTEDFKFIRPMELFLFDSPEEYQYWKITFIDENNPDGYLELGRAFLGPVFRPIRNFKVDFQIQPFKDPSRNETSLGQIAHSDGKQKFSEIKLNFQNVEPDEVRWGFAHLQNVVGLTEDFFISLEPDQSVSDWFYSVYYGRLSKEIDIRPSRNNSHLRNVSLAFRESL